MRRAVMDCGPASSTDQTNTDLPGRLTKRLRGNLTSYPRTCSTWHRSLVHKIPERLRNYLNSIKDRWRNLGNYATVPEFGGNVMKIFHNTVCAIAVLIVLTPGLFAQWPSYPTPGVPKGPDGKANLTAPAP